MTFFVGLVENSSTYFILKEYVAECYLCHKEGVVLTAGEESSAYYRRVCITCRTIKPWKQDILILNNEDELNAFLIARSL